MVFDDDCRRDILSATVLSSEDMLTSSWSLALSADNIVHFNERPHADICCVLQYDTADDETSCQLQYDVVLEPKNFRRLYCISMKGRILTFAVMGAEWQCLLSSELCGSTSVPQVLSGAKATAARKVRHGTAAPRYARGSTLRR